MRIPNKKAGEKILSIWWFVSLALIGVAVVIVILTYFGAFVDVRPQETSMLREKIMDCVVKEGFLINRILELESNEFLIRCNLNRNSFKEDSPFLFNLTIYNSEGKMVKNITSGSVARYQQDCIATSEIKTRNYPFCIENKETIQFFNETSYKREDWNIYLLVASDNHGYKSQINLKSDEI